MSKTVSELNIRTSFLDFFSNKIIVVYFLVILLLKFLLVFIPPQFTTDLLRSIFYGQHFWNIGFDVYNLTPIQIDPNFHITDPTTHLLAWPNNTYDYGVVSLLYYAIIGLLPFSTTTLVVIAKIILNIADIITLVLLVTLYPKNREIPVLFWFVMLPFSSLEGQPLSITLLFFITSLYFYKKNNKLLAYVIMAVGFHWKYVTVLLLPYYLINDLCSYYNIEKTIKPKPFKVYKPIISFFIVFILLMFPLLFSRYIWSYISFGGNLLVTSLPWNPFFIGYPFTFASFLLLFFVLYILYQGFILVKKEQRSIFSLSGLLPLIGLFSFLLIYKYAFPWYWLWSLPLFSVLPFDSLRVRKNFIIFGVVCLVASIEFINWTVGFPFILNYLFYFKA